MTKKESEAWIFSENINDACTKVTQRTDLVCTAGVKKQNQVTCE